MKKQPFNLFFYLKLITIVIVVFMTYSYHQGTIHAILNQKELTSSQQLLKIGQVILGYSMPTSPPKIATPIRIQSYPGNTEPIQFDDSVLGHPQFLRSQAKADDFNQMLDLQILNHEFIVSFNQEMGQSFSLGDHLREGNRVRLAELNHYAYLSSHTPQQGNFRDHFSFIEDNQYRIGENLYEVFISADDIHLQTWSQHPSVFAEYLTQVFLQEQEDLSQYQSLYLSAMAAASDYQLDQNPFVRIVVVLTFDTQKIKR